MTSAAEASDATCPEWCVGCGPASTGMWDAEHQSEPVTFEFDNWFQAGTVTVTRQRHYDSTGWVSAEDLISLQVVVGDDGGEATVYLQVPQGAMVIHNLLQVLCNIAGIGMPV